MNNKAYQAELDRFFQTINHSEIPEHILYKGNVSKARAKLKYQAFTNLNKQLVRYFYDYFPHETWFGFTLMAIDGTTLRVPDTQEIKDHFGVWHSVKGEKPCPKARASQLFDVLNKITVDAIISPFSHGEIELAATHCLHLQPNDLILLDRGYPAQWLFRLILSVGAHFCARISFKKWNVVKKFYKSGKNEQIVTLKPSSLSMKKCDEIGIDTGTVTVRLVRVELETGETEILVTSLLDMDQYPIGMFMDLYHLRWPIEEDYKTIKYRLEIENFSGKSVHSVYQDFHAKLFSKNITSVIATTTKTDIDNKSANCKYCHKINFALALSNMKNTVVLLFNPIRLSVDDIVQKIRLLFIKYTEAVRHNRKFPRKHRVKLQRFSFAYKTSA